MTTVAIPSTHGTFTARFSERGLARLNFPSHQATEVDSTGALPDPVKRWIKQTKSALDAILSGRSPTEMPPFDLTAGTEFQRGVWEQMTRIPMGQTLSYGEIAAALGKPGATRAVGNACGANPIPVLIPCHRVLAAQGKLGGFSSGIGWKRRLLACEGHSVKPDQVL